MATQHEILRVLSASGPISRNKIGEFVGEGYRNFQTQLDRLNNKGLIHDTGDHVYLLTTQGEQALAEMNVSLPERFAITITEADLIKLDDAAFAKVWDVLGKILQNR